MRQYPETLSAPGWEHLTLEPRLALVELREPVDPASADELLAPAGLALARTPDASWQVDQHPWHLWVENADGAPLPVASLAETLEGAGLRVAHLAPVYGTEVAGRAANVAVLPDVVLVDMAGDPGGLVELATSLGLAVDEERSRYLGTYSAFTVPGDIAAWTARDRLVEAFPGADVRLSVASMEYQLTGVPNDPLFGSQWNMTRIHAPEAWDVATGNPSVVIAIVESEAVGAHPDLLLAAPPVDPFYGTPAAGWHATSCAGIAAAVAGNSAGVAGVATGCRILSVCSSKWSDEGLAAAVRYAVAHGADVVSMSFTANSDYTFLPAALAEAAAQGVVLCGATGNNDAAFVTYPASSPVVIAVGGSDKQDRRARPMDEYTGSQYGPELSVVAPSVDAMTTTWTSAGQPDYAPFKGTSCAAPHVAGIAALLLGKYPGMSAARVRSIVERTAVKPAGVAFADDPAYPNGTRNPEIGYGRVDAFRALDFADVMIRDYPEDTGAEPSAPPNGVFWERSDIVVQPALVPLLLFNTDPVAASRFVRGVDNRIYVRVRNAGPATARNVRVDVRVAAFAGTGFRYPGDWTAVDDRHLAPAAESPVIATLAAGTDAFATFLLSAAQVGLVDAWTFANMHPCVLAVVTADNDYAFASVVTNDDRVVVRRNNVAQRNVTVTNLLGLDLKALPLLVGSEFGEEGMTRLVIDRSGLPENAELLIDVPHDADAFRVTQVDGGEVTEIENVRTLAVRGAAASMGLELDRGALVPLTARLRLPEGTAPDTPAILRITQQDAQGTVLGGVTVIGVAEDVAEPEPHHEIEHPLPPDLAVDPAPFHEIAHPLPTDLGVDPVLPLRLRRIERRGL